MIAPYSIKINGVWIRAGENIPPFNDPKTPDENTENREPHNDGAESKPKHTKREITFMKVADLRKLAKEEGLADDPDRLNGTELKELLINHYEL